MQDNETVTVTISKSDVNYLRNYVITMSEAFTAVCSTAIDERATNDQKILVGKLSVLHSDCKLDAIAALDRIVKQ